MVKFKRSFYKVGESSKRIPPSLKWLVLIAILGGAVYWFFFRNGNDGKDHNAATPVTLSSAVKKDVPVYLDGLGTVQAYNTVTVHSQVDGQIIAVQFQEGQDVHAGDVLAKIDPRTYQAQYNQAVANKAKDEATLENAKLDLARYIHLGTAVSAQTLDTQRATVRQVEATVNADQAAIDNAATMLSYTTIASPIDGRTGIRQVDLGNIVHTADANGLVVITQLEPISVIFSLPQQNLRAINEQIAVQGKLQVLAIGEDNHTTLDTGILELVDNEIDQSTGTIKLKATFPNTKRALWPGGFTNVRMLLMVRKDAVVIPTVAVQRGPQNGAYVFLYKADDSTVSMQTVEVAMTEGQDTVIANGLKEGDQVITDGMAKLQDGSKVKLAGDDGKKEDTSGDADKDKKKHGHKQD